MTEHKQASPINFFTTSATSVKHGAASFNAFDSERSTDLSFSRELSLASVNSTSKRRRSESSQSDAFEPTAQRKPLRSEKHNAPSAQSTTRSDARPATAHEKSSSAGGDKNDVTSSANEAEKNSQHDSNSVQSAQPEDAAKSESNVNAVDSDTASTVDSEVPDEIALAYASEIEQTNTEDSNAAESENDNIPITAPLTDLAGDQADPKETTQSQLLDAQGIVSAAALAGNAKEDASVKTSSTVQTMTAGDQLSPAQLANRQAHLVHNPMLRDAVSAQSAAPIPGENPEEGEIPLVSTRPVLSTGVTTLAGVIAQVKGSHAATDASEAQAMLVSANKAPEARDEAQLLNVKQHMLNADLKAAADADARIVALRAKQEMVQEKLTQARQSAVQQVQLANPTIAAASTATADTGNQSMDNMFLSLPGGIVTAPVLQRAEAGTTQPINAPINMHILKDDADKAMSSNIRWMVNEGVKNAVVNVTPSGMGPISVSVGIEKDQMSISIIASQGSTREALDSMLPRLREQLAAQGHDSVKVDISDGRADQADRGYGQQYSGEQQSNEHDTHEAGARVTAEESQGTAINDMQTDTGSVQAQIVVGSDGNVRRNYDVYV